MPRVFNKLFSSSTMKRIISTTLMLTLFGVTVIAMDAYNYQAAIKNSSWTTSLLTPEILKKQRKDAKIEVNVIANEKSRWIALKQRPVLYSREGELDGWRRSGVSVVEQTFKQDYNGGPKELKDKYSRYWQKLPTKNPAQVKKYVDKTLNTLDDNEKVAKRRIASIPEDGSMIVDPSADIYGVYATAERIKKSANVLAVKYDDTAAKVFANASEKNRLTAKANKFRERSKKAGNLADKAKQTADKLEKGTITKAQAKAEVEPGLLEVEKDIYLLDPSLDKNEKTAANIETKEVKAVREGLYTDAPSVEVTKTQQEGAKAVEMVTENVKPVKTVPTSPKTRGELAAAAVEGTKKIMIDSDGDGVPDSKNPNLSAADELTAARAVYAYLADVNAFAQSGEGFEALGKDNLEVFLRDNASDLALVMYWHAQSINESVMGTGSTNNKFNYSAKAHELIPDIVESYRIAVQTGSGYVKDSVQRVIGDDAQTMQKYETYRKAHNYKDIDMLRMFNFFNNDPGTIVEYMGLADGKFYDPKNPNNPGQDINWSNIKMSDLVKYQGLVSKADLERLKAGQGIKKPEATAPTIANNAALTDKDARLPNGVPVALSADLKTKVDLLADCYLEYAIAYGYNKASIEGSIQDIRNIIAGNINSSQKFDPYESYNFYDSMMKAFERGKGPDVYTFFNSAFGGNVLTLKNKMYRTGIGINPKTGNVEYSTTIKKRNATGTRMETVGYISFDPVNKTVDGQVPVYMKGKQITLYSDPRVGDVYVEYSNSRLNGDLVPLYKYKDNLQIMTVSVSKDGKIGGSFKMMHKIFNFNPNSQAFEYQAISKAGKQIWVDTKGNVRGQVAIGGGATQGYVFFDRTGDVGLSFDYSTTNKVGEKQILGNISIGKNGQVGGTVDVGKLIGGKNSASFFVGFDKHGVSGISINMGSIQGKPFGLGVAKDGSLTFGGFVPIAGMPVPVGVGQDAHGNFRLAWPGGSLKLFGNENRPLTAPAPELDEKNNVKAECIYFRHRFKKGTKKVRVYQVPCERIDPTEQKERGDMIFKTYNELLQRNPSIEELFSYYFYGGHEMYNLKEQTKKEYRMSQTEFVLRGHIMGATPHEVKGFMGVKRMVTEGGMSKYVPQEYRFGNDQEYAWIVAGKDPKAAPTRPQTVLESNPFTGDQIQQAKTTNPSDGEAETDAATANEADTKESQAIKDFNAGIVADEEADTSS